MRRYARAEAQSEPEDEYAEEAGALFGERSLFNIGFFIGLGFLTAQLVFALIAGIVALIIIAT